MSPPTPRRVLILNHNLREHGTWFRAIKVAEQLRDRGHRVTLVTTGNGYYRPRRRVENGMTIWETPSWEPIFGLDGGWSPLGLWVRLALAQSHRWDVVWSFSHKPVDDLPARLARRVWRAKWIADWCDLWGGEGIIGLRRAGRPPARTWKEQLRNRMEEHEAAAERRTALRCDALTVISTDLRNRALAWGVAPERIHLFLSGAETDRIQPRDRDTCRRELGLPLDRPVIAYVTNYYPDQDLLLDAFARVFAQHPTAMAVTTGPEFYGGDGAALGGRGIADRVRRLGRVPFETIPVVLGAADVLALPLGETAFNRSRWPHKIGDYLASGRPMAVCAVGDVESVLGSAGVARLCDATAEGLAQGLLDLLALSAEQRAEMGRKARQFAEERLSWHELVKNLLSQFGTGGRPKHRL